MLLGPSLPSAGRRAWPPGRVALPGPALGRGFPLGRICSAWRRPDSTAGRTRPSSPAKPAPTPPQGPGWAGNLRVTPPLLDRPSPSGRPRSALLRPGFNSLREGAGPLWAEAAAGQFRPSVASRSAGGRARTSALTPSTAASAWCSAGGRVAGWAVTPQAGPHRWLAKRRQVRQPTASPRRSKAEAPIVRPRDRSDRWPRAVFASLHTSAGDITASACSPSLRHHLLCTPISTSTAMGCGS